MDCIWVNLKNVGPPFFKFISVNIKMPFKQLENQSKLQMKDSCSANLTFGAQTNKNKQNYLKQRDLAPLKHRNK